MTDLHPITLTYILVPVGLIVGSLANGLIHRLLPKSAGRDTTTRPSHCPACGGNIRWFHFLPLLSWLHFLRKCAGCGWGEPLRYPTVELLTAALFALAHWVFPFGTLVWFKGLICGIALIVLFFVGLAGQRLPDALQFPLMALGLLFTIPQIFWLGKVIRVALGESMVVQPYVAPMFHNGTQYAPAAWVMWGNSVKWKESLMCIAAAYCIHLALGFAYAKIRGVAAGIPSEIPLGHRLGVFKMLAWLGAFWGWAAMLGIVIAGAAIMYASMLPWLFLRKQGWRAGLPLGCCLAIATPMAVLLVPWLKNLYPSLLR